MMRHWTIAALCAATLAAADAQAQVRDTTVGGRRARVLGDPAPRPTGAARTAPAAQIGTPHYDVVLEVPELSVDSIGLTVADLRAVFRGVALLRERDPAFYARLRIHFFGTTYDPRAPQKLVEPVARELGVADVVDERPARVPYLDALNIVTRADAVLGLGSSERHYTASKIFPNILSRRPVLAIYHEASSVCDIMRRANAGILVTYGDEQRAESRVEEIADAMVRLHEPGVYDPARVRWDSFAEYSAENMTRQLARQFDGVIERGGLRGGTSAGAA